MKPVSVKDAVAAYLSSLHDKGQRPSTIKTAERSLDLFVLHVGGAAIVAEISVVDVVGFYACNAAKTLRGKPRAKLSILQIRRVIRYFLVWCQQAGLVEVAPLPAKETT